MMLPNGTPNCLALYDQILDIAISISGDPAKAARWCEQDPIACLGGKTAKKLAAENRGAEVLRYMQSLEAGAAGVISSPKK